MQVHEETFGDLKRIMNCANDRECQLLFPIQNKRDTTACNSISADKQPNGSCASLIPLIKVAR